MQLNPARRDDSGFTLIELLVTIAILGVIAVPLGNVMIGFWTNTNATTERLALSHDTQISSAYFARDVAAIGIRDYTATGATFQKSVELDVAHDAGVGKCGLAGTPVAKVRFLADDWEWDAAAVMGVARTTATAYYLTPPIGAAPVGQVRELHRIKCVGTSSTPVSDVVLAHNVDPATPVVVTCSSACDGTPAPEHVKLAFSVIAPNSDAYPITLVGQRRQT